jgi:predicted DNA-binding transcriptional regulator AlpA
VFFFAARVVGFGQQITSRAVGWVEEEVRRWLAERRDRR